MKQIMKRAWEIAREAVAQFGGKIREYFGESLRIAWAEFKMPAKKTVFDLVPELEKMGFKRWQKVGNGKSFDRLYVDAREIGLEVSYYKTGNVSGATFDGYSISNSEARRMMASKTYIDLIARRIYSDNAIICNKVCEICGVDPVVDYSYSGKATIVNFSI